YLELSGPNADQIGKGTNGVATWSIINLGSQAIQYETELWLTDQNNNELQRQSYQNQIILSGQTRNVNETLQTNNLEPGNYNVYKKLTYDDVEITKDKLIRIGTKSINIIEHPTTL